MEIHPDYYFFAIFIEARHPCTQKVVSLDEVGRLKTVLEDEDVMVGQKCDTIARLETLTLSRDLIVCCPSFARWGFLSVIHDASIQQ